MRPLRAQLLVPVLLLLAPPLSASVPRARLSYDRGELAGCPSREDLVGAVAARLGADPFKEPAELSIRIVLMREGEQLVAEVGVEEEGGPVGLRRLASRQGDCAELGAALVLTVSLAIDPLASVGAPEPPKPEPPKPGPARTSSPAVAASPTPVGWSLSASMIAGFGLTPDAGLGGALGAGIFGQRWALELEGRFFAPTEAHLARGSGTSVALIDAQLSPCFRIHPAIALCALVAVGAHRASAINLVNTNPVTTPFLAAGARLAAEPFAIQPIALFLFAELAVSLIRTTLEAGAGQAWSSPDLGGVVGLGLRFRSG